MTDPSAEGRQLLPEESKSFTEEDVELVADALWQDVRDGHTGVGRRPTPGCYHDAKVILAALASAGRLLPASAEHREEWGCLVTEPHPRRREVVGDVITLTEEQARYGPKIWSGWSTVKRTVVAPGPWVEVLE